MIDLPHIANKSFDLKDQVARASMMEKIVLDQRAIARPLRPNFCAPSSVPIPTFETF
jgi:hypothetical protein